MSRAREQATVPGWAAQASVLGVVLAVLLPSLLVTTDLPLSATLALLTLALAGLAALGALGLARSSTLVAAGATDDGDVLLLPGRVTDPVHNPLRPRAPGQA
ncbi:MAG: hypothetical protein ABWX73_08505 [Marmoricola sp.]